MQANFSLVYTYKPRCCINVQYDTAIRLSELLKCAQEAPEPERFSTFFYSMATQLQSAFAANENYAQSRLCQI